MERLSRKLQAVLTWLTARDCPPDPLETMNPHQRADLPIYHPLRRDGLSC